MSIGLAWLVSGDEKEVNGRLQRVQFVPVIESQHINGLDMARQLIEGLMIQPNRGYQIILPFSAKGITA
jgi:hypothetical protein